MSEVESKEAQPSLTSPILSTSPRIIPIRLLISIAIFLFKTAVVADHMGTGGTPMFTVEERYTFRERRIFPDGISMWIGALENSFRGTFKTLHVVPRAITDNDFGLYIFTFIVGHLVLQLAAAKWATPHLNKILGPIQRESDAEYMAWFWPIAGNIEWPPPKYVPASHLDQLSDRWKGGNIVAAKKCDTLT